nr:GNAT family N-acetyltransferase [Stackebrandtia nassauensis]
MLYGVLRLRTDVFVVEQKCPYPELDGRDTEPQTRHVWATENDRVVAYLRITAEPDGFRVGRVCTEAASRGQGLAGKLVETALIHTGETPVWMHAQVSVVPFYERYGFAVQGPQFLEDDIPHVLMRRP